MVHPFPPKSNKRANADVTGGGNVGRETPATSTGGGGIPASLRAKAAGTKGTPGLEKKNSAS